VCPRPGLDMVVKNSQPSPELEPPIIQTVVQRYTTDVPRLLTSCTPDVRKMILMMMMMMMIIIIIIIIIIIKLYTLT
jgi:hypothetical protein